MPKSNESINRELFDLLSTRGYRPTMLDTSGKEIPVPEEAEVFQFNFVKDDVDYGVVTISIDGLHKLVIYFNDKIADSEKEVSDTDDVSWYRLLNHLKRFAKNRQLSFQVKNTDHLKHDMAKRDHMKKLDEGYYPIGKNKSYSDAVPQVKIVIEHTRNIVEGEQRYRNVARIFVENTDGERFLLPTIKPGIARVYARHIAEGGTPYDDRANHITSLVEDYNKMAGFVRATRNGQFNESAQRLVLEGANHYTKLRETLSRMAGGRGYNKYFESWTPSLMEDEVEETNLNELFVQETLDPRIESVMPILSKLQKNLGEMKEVDALAEWADKLLEGGDGGEASEEPPESKEGETAEDGNEAPEDDLSEAAGAETLSHNDETEEGNLKAFDLEEGFAVNAIKKGVKALDRIVTGGNKEDLLKDLKQKAGVRNPENGKPSMAYSDVEKRVAEEVDTGQYDAVKSSPKGSDGNNWDKPFREKVRQYAKELKKRQKEKEQGVAEADELRARGGLAAINKNPRPGQIDLRNIPAGNYPGSQNQFTDKDRKKHTDNLKAKIKSTLGKHTRPNLPESGVTESEFAGDYATGEAGQWRNKGPKANKPATIGDLVGENVEEGKGPLGQGDLGLALKSLGGSWSSWHEEDSHDPDIEVYEYDDGEGGYYASGSIEHNLKTGEIEVHYQDGENDVDVDGTFNSIGDAMKALRGGNSYPSWGGKKPNFDRLGQRKQHGPDDLRKTDRTGRKGTLAGGPTNSLKQNIQWSKGKHGPKGVLPEGQEDLDTIRRLLGK